MIQEGIEILIWPSTVITRKAIHFLQVRAVYRDDLNAGNRGRGSRVRFADISSTD
jgi:hypothetical protein